MLRQPITKFFCQMSQKVTETHLQAGIGVLLFLISLNILGPLRLSLLSIAFLLTRKWVLKKLERIHEVGLVNYLPEGLKTALLSRSIFDYLCDIWYFPTIPKVLKVIIKPMVINTDPVEAEKNLEELDVNLQLAIKTKGILNILPLNVQKALLPKGQSANTQTASQPSVDSQALPSKRSPVELGSPVSNFLRDLSPRAVYLSNSETKKKQKKNLEVPKEPKGTNDSNDLMVVPKSANMPRMKIISTSRALKEEKLKENAIINSKWDKLEQFITKEKLRISKGTQRVKCSFCFVILAGLFQAAFSFEFDPPSHSNQKWRVQTYDFRQENAQGLRDFSLVPHLPDFIL